MDALSLQAAGPSPTPPVISGAPYNVPQPELEAPPFEGKLQRDAFVRAEIDVGRKTVALCRCGKSRIRPFCDGTHALVRFRAPSEAERGREAGGAARPDAGRFSREPASESRPAD